MASLLLNRPDCHGPSTYATCGRCIDRRRYLAAAIYQTDAGRELRVGFSETDLVHRELSRDADGPLLTRAKTSARY